MYYTERIWYAVKKIIGFLICLTLILPNFTLAVNAEEEKMVYYSFISNGRLGAAAVDITASTNAQSITENADGGYITVTPVPGTTGSMNQWGGFNMKLRFMLSGAQKFDFSDTYDDMYIRVKIKSAVVPKNVWVRTNRNNGNGWNAATNGMIASTPDEDNWYEGLISFKTVMKDDLNNRVTSFRDLYIGFGYASGAIAEDVDVAEVSIVGPDVRKKPTSVKAQMDDGGNYRTTLKYASSLGSGAADRENYKIGDVTAEKVTVSGNEVSIEFDMQPDFPSDLRLEISENAKCADGYPLYPNIELKNAVTYTAAIKDGYTIGVKDGEAAFSGEISCIYDKAGEGINVTVFVAVYDETDGNNFIAGGFSETKVISHKESADFEVKIEDESIKSGMTAKIFIVDTAAVGRPLAAVK